MRRLDIPFQLSRCGLPGSLMVEGLPSPEIRSSAGSLRARRRCRMLARFSFPIELRSSQERSTCQNRVRREYPKC